MSTKTENRIALSFLLMIFGVLGTTPLLHAQAVSNATVTGRVTDQEGAVLSGAQVKIHGVDTGTAHDIRHQRRPVFTRFRICP